MTTTPTTGDPMTTTDHQQAAEKLAQEMAALHLHSPFDMTEGAWRGLRALIAIVASIPAPQQPQDGPEPTPEGDGTTDPGSGPETGARRLCDHGYPTGANIITDSVIEDMDVIHYHGQHTHIHGAKITRVKPDDLTPRETGARRFKVGDRVQVRYFGPCTLPGVVDDVDNTDPDGDGVHVIRIADGVGMWVPTRLVQHLGARPDDDPPLGPVVLPTTPGSVAWTRDGGICALTDDTDVPWLGVAGDRTAWCFSAPDLLALVVVRVFDAGTGRLRPFAAGTVDEVARLREDLDDLRVQRDSARRVRDEALRERDEERARIERAWSLVNNYHGLGVPTKMLADALSATHESGTVA